MIDRITGTLVHADDTGWVVEVGGIGLKLRMAGMGKAPPSAGSRVSLVVETVVSRQAIDLYGFHTVEERERFRGLTSIPGIGGVTALKLLPHVEAVRAGRFEELPAVAGIGPAKRARLARWLKRHAPADGEEPKERQVRMALEALGIEPAGARTLARRAVTTHPGASVPELVRAAVAGRYDKGARAPGGGGAG